MPKTTNICIISIRLFTASPQLETGGFGTIVICEVDMSPTSTTMTDITQNEQEGSHKRRRLAKQHVANKNSQFPKKKDSSSILFVLLK